VRGTRIPGRMDALHRCRARNTRLQPDRKLKSQESEKNAGQG
jgi:hypothetical protein